jgi:hypothetical protein
MKSYKINIKAVIAIVAILSLVIFSIVLVIFHIAKTLSLGEILLHYGYIIAPITILWVLTDRYFWHTKVLQSIRKSLNIPPDLRGRWEGVLENADGSEPQKFAIEVTQTLTTLCVHSFSSIGRSDSILCEIASSHNEDKFTLCYLWQGQINTPIKHISDSEHFDGYTMLHLDEHQVPKTLTGSYFTNRKPSQTHGGIELKWVSHSVKRRLE